MMTEAFSRRVVSTRGLAGPLATAAMADIKSKHKGGISSGRKAGLAYFK